jgi:hypothetical protein
MLLHGVIKIQIVHRALAPGIRWGQDTCDDFSMVPSASAGGDEKGNYFPANAERDPNRTTSIIVTACILRRSIQHLPLFFKSNKWQQLSTVNCKSVYDSAPPIGKDSLLLL